MKLPFAAYTARNGYEWICGLDAGLSHLEQLRKAIGKLPEFDFGDPLSCGAVNTEDTVIAYKFMREKKGDFRGRDSLYLAFTYFPRSTAGAVNFAEVLAYGPLAKPMRQPPPSLEYCGSGADECDFEPDHAYCSGDLPEGMDLACAGSIFQQPFSGTLRIFKKDNASRYSYIYTPPAPVEKVLTCGGGTNDAPLRLSGQPSPVLDDQLTSKWIQQWGEIAVAAVLFLLTAGYILWVKTDLFRPDKAQPFCYPVSEAAVDK